MNVENFLFRFWRAALKSMTHGWLATGQRQYVCITTGCSQYGGKKYIWIRQVGLAPSSKASMVGFHFPGGSLTLSSSLIPYLQLWTWQWDFKGRLLNEAIPLFGLSCNIPNCICLYWMIFEKIWFCRTWLKPPPICSFDHYSLIFLLACLQGSLHHYDDQDDVEYCNEWWPRWWWLW